MIAVCKQQTSARMAVEAHNVMEKCRELMTRYNEHKAETNEDDRFASIQGPEKVTQVFTYLSSKLRSTK